MPSSTPKQAKFMRAVAHNPTFAAKVKVPQKVGKDFAKADAQVKATKLAIQKANNAGKGYSASTASSSDGGVGTGRMAATTPARTAPLPRSTKVATAKAAAQRQRSTRQG